MTKKRQIPPHTAHLPSTPTHARLTTRNANNYVEDPMKLHHEINRMLSAQKERDTQETELLVRKDPPIINLPWWAHLMHMCMCMTDDEYRHLQDAEAYRAYE